MNNIYVVPQFSGAQLGTKDNPFEARNSLEFDALMRKLYLVLGDSVTVHLNDGTFWTMGTREWEDTNDIQQNPGFRIGRHWVIESETDATLAWDHEAISDDRITETPHWLILSTEQRFDSRLNQHTPQDAWDLLPRGQTVRGLKIDLRFAQVIDRWKGLGKDLRLGGVLLTGHEAAIEKVKVTNYGTLSCESFPLYIQGSLGMYGRDLIAQLDPATHIFDADIPDERCSHITDCDVSGYVESSDDQVTLRFISGGIGERTPGKWIHHMRAYAYQSGNTSYATGANMVQAHTIYQSLRGLITDNISDGCSVGYYGDFYKTKGVVIRNNKFRNCRFYGVQLQLSPTGPDAENYSHEDYVIGPNQIDSLGANVFLSTYGPPSSTRYIKNIKIDSALSVENFGAENVVRTAGGIPITELEKRKGCRLW